MFSRVTALPLWAHAGLAAAAFAGFQAVKTRLDASYAASNHPVDYATGQLAFDAEKIEGYYAAIQAKGTLEVYWTTQFIDFGFIAGVMALGVLLGTLAARLGPVGSLGRKLGFAVAVLAVVGAGFDALENLLSFVLLQDPSNIAQPLALAYSSAAAVKFGLLSLAMLALLLSIVAGVWARFRARRS